MPPDGKFNRPSCVAQRRPFARGALRAGLALAAMLAIGSTPASAQSLSELYEAARAYDAAYLAARALADSARYRVAQVEALNRPSAALAGNLTRAEADTPLGHRESTTRAVSLSARQPLFNRTNDANIAQARRSLDVAVADLDTAEQDLVLRIAQAYFDVLNAQDTLAFARASRTAITEQLAAAKRNFEVGTATITDTREAQARFDLATATEIAAENDLRTRRIALDQLVGRANVSPRPLAVPVQLPPPVPADVEALVGQAEAQHPLVRRALANRDIAQLETRKARAGHYPTVDAVASAAVNKVRGVSTTGAATLPGTTQTATAALQLQWPLFSGFAVQNRIRETLLLEERAGNDLEAARRGVAQTTRQVFFAVQSGQAQARALEAAEASSLLALEATQLGYKVGVRVNLDVLNAQTQLFQTRRDLAKARYDVIVGGLRLRQAAGILRPEDVNAANALLAP